MLWRLRGIVAHDRSRALPAGDARTCRGRARRLTHRRGAARATRRGASLPGMNHRKPLAADAPVSAHVPILWLPSVRQRCIDTLIERIRFSLTHDHLYTYESFRLADDEMFWCIGKNQSHKW